MLSLLRPSLSMVGCCGIRQMYTATARTTTFKIGQISWNCIRRISQRAPLLKEEIRRKAKQLSEKEVIRRGSRDTVYYLVGFSVFMLGGCWAAIPLYRMFCSDTSYGGGLGKYKRDTDIIDKMSPVKDRVVRIRFNADAGGSMYWKFKPLQEFVDVYPGETALAFFTATNPTDKPIIGVSTYNIVPYEAAAYFNKIQCFCFEEQLLNPGEQVDLPVFFYLDPDFAFDPMISDLDEVVLSYTFFQSKSNVILKRPSGMTVPKLSDSAGDTILSKAAALGNA